MGRGIGTERMARIEVIDPFSLIIHRKKHHRSSGITDNGIYCGGETHSRDHYRLHGTVVIGLD